MARRRRMNPVTAGLIAGATAATTMATVYATLVRPWIRRWGSTNNEAACTLPGDDLIASPKLAMTHAVTIDASACDIWEWLIQIGQGRGGFYSYDRLENLMGLDIHSADRIIPELQDLKEGDRIPLAPNGFSIPVAILEPCHSLVLFGDSRVDSALSASMPPGDYFAASWGWTLVEIGSHTTRLVERWRADWNPSPRNTLFMRAFLEPGAFVMSRKMLLGIKARAEAGQRAMSAEISLGEIKG